MENKWLVAKQDKVSTKEGKDILTLDLDTLEYRAAKKLLCNT
jgi:3-hydroxyacyl-CoA dehydrogenase